MNIGGPTQDNVEEVDSLFIGGGPATLCIFSHAYKTDCLRHLICGAYHSSNYRGVAIIEK